MMLAKIKFPIQQAKVQYKVWYKNKINGELINVILSVIKLN